MLENLIKDAHGTIGYKPFAVLLVPLRLPTFRNFGWRGSAWWNKVAHLEVIDAQMSISIVSGLRFCNLRSKRVMIERCNAGGLKDRDSWSLSSPIAPHLRDVTHLAQPRSSPVDLRILSHGRKPDDSEALSPYRLTEYLFWKTSGNTEVWRL